MRERAARGIARRGSRAEQHRRGIAQGAVALHEVEAARHPQQVLELDPGAGVGVPAGNPRRRRRVEPSAQHLDADQRRHHALGHRPAEQRRLRVEAGGIALRHHPSRAQHQHGAGAAVHRGIRLAEGAGDRGVESGALRSGERRLRAEIAVRPGDGGGIGRGPRIEALRAQRVDALSHRERAAEAVAIHRGAAREAEPETSWRCAAPGRPAAAPTRTSRDPRPAGIPASGRRRRRPSTSAWPRSRCRPAARAAARTRPSAGRRPALPRESDAGALGGGDYLARSGSRQHPLRIVDGQAVAPGREHALDLGVGLDGVGADLEPPLRARAGPAPRSARRRPRPPSRSRPWPPRRSAPGWRPSAASRAGASASRAAPVRAGRGGTRSASRGPRGRRPPPARSHARVSLRDRPSARRGSGAASRTFRTGLAGS